MGYEEISSTHPKAKKEYSCEWCGQAVLIGEKHWSRAYKFEGDFNSGRMHLECEKAMKKTPHTEIEDGWAFGSNERGR